MNSSIFPTLLLLLILPASAQESSEDATVIELRETISKIVETQSQSSRERNAWEERKATMAALLDLHYKELVLLNEEFKTSGASAGGFDETKTANEAELASLKTARRNTSATIGNSIPRLMAITKRLPTPLLTDCETDLAALAAWKAGDEPRNALQPMLSIISKSIQFNRRVTRSTEVRDGREVGVIYLGLSNAYYADRGKLAGIGRPTADGWQWTPRPELHGEVTKAFSILDQKRPPALLELPVTLD